MKKIYILFALFILITSAAFSQNLTKITLGETGHVSAITYELSEGVVINITQDGTIGDWGVDIYKGYRENYYNKLEPYTGRTEYYKENDNEAFRGKIKFVGITLFTYYASYEDETLAGKLKSIGRVRFEYYPKYDNEAYKGRLKTAGTLTFSYYAGFGNDPNAGKLKTVGNTTFSYYGAFDDNAFKGKIKSIGNIPFTYYSSSETMEWRGRIKTGSYQQAVNGIKYYIRG